MSQFDQVLENIIQINSPQIPKYNRIFVVSAYSGVTNWLLEHKKTGEPGVYNYFLRGEDFSAPLFALLQRLLEINTTLVPLGLDLAAANAFITERIKQAETMLKSLSQVLASGYVLEKDIHLAAREILASIGEAHSAFNSTSILTNHNIPARMVDLCGFEDNHAYTIDERIHYGLQGIDFTQGICIATGYTKGTEGIMRAFDRGYSEVTFSKIAVEVQADEAIIHKEYHLSSADPGIVGVENCVPVGLTNFIVADQLADIGMEAIHPKAAKPLELAGINIRIKNTFEPLHDGTLISKDYQSPTPKVEIVSGSNQMLAVEIHDPLMVSEVGYDARIMEYFMRYGISYVLKSTNANSITMVVWDTPVAREMIEVLKENFYQVNFIEAAMVCAMGTNLSGPGFLYRATKALYENGINIECYGQSLMQVNLQFVLLRASYNDAIRALNASLCTPGANK